MFKYLKDSWKAYRRIPKAGEPWGYIKNEDNPWLENKFFLLYVKDVKEGWVCFTYFEEDTNKPINQINDRFMHISDFKFIFAPYDELIKQIKHL